MFLKYNTHIIQFCLYLLRENIKIKFDFVFFNPKILKNKQVHNFNKVFEIIFEIMLDCVECVILVQPLQVLVTID